MSRKPHETKQKTKSSDKKTSLLEINSFQLNKPLRVCFYANSSIDTNSLITQLDRINNNDSDRLYDIQFSAMTADVKTPSTSSSSTFKSNLKIDADLVVVVFDLSVPLDKTMVKETLKPIQKVFVKCNFAWNVLGINADRALDSNKVFLPEGKAKNKCAHAVSTGVEHTLSTFLKKISETHADHLRLTKAANMYHGLQ